MEVGQGRGAILHMTHRPGCNLQALLRAALVGALAWQAGAGTLRATELLMKDGRLLIGKARLTSPAWAIPYHHARGREARKTRPSPCSTTTCGGRSSPSSRSRTPVPTASSRLAGYKFRRRASAGQRAAGRGWRRSAGPIISITPFDEYGRRIFTMNTFKEPVPVVQAITEVTPHWTKVEGVKHVWDMRIATSSIPRDVLGQILMRRIDPKDIEQRKRSPGSTCRASAIRTQPKSYNRSRPIFPEAAQQGQIASSLHALRQLAAKQILSELRLRREAGQHQLVMRSLEHFPSEGVDGEVLQIVREMIADYQALEGRRKQALAKIDELLAKVSDSYQLKPSRPIRDEIAAELSLDTTGRMTRSCKGSTTRRPRPGKSWPWPSAAGYWAPTRLRPSWGWRFPPTTFGRRCSEYLNEPLKINRASLYHVISSEEAATPQLVAALLAQMKPPVDLPAANPDRAGLLRAGGARGARPNPPVHYFVQLPPEYDPHRRYPAIVTLHGAGTTAENQIDWWAGRGTAAARKGQATRRGYIVIAPDWTLDHQNDYRYSGREHAAVLDSLRDACRRFSVDGDRVFLSGHDIGGDAAWDIALAHPDFWAGVIPIVATADRYIRLYWENAKSLPVYFVCGELDGNKMTLNAPSWIAISNAVITAPWPNFWAAATKIFPTRSCGCSTGWADSIASSSPAISRAPRCAASTITSGGWKWAGCPDGPW